MREGHKMREGEMEGETEGRQIKVEGLHWSPSGLWMTKYGAVRVLLGLLGDSPRVWCCQARLADECVG